MGLTSKQEASANGDQPKKTVSEFVKLKDEVIRAIHRYRIGQVDVAADWAIDKLTEMLACLEVVEKENRELRLIAHCPAACRNSTGETRCEQLTAQAHQQTKPDILALLQEADKALLEGKAAVVHSCLRQAITELLPCQQPTEEGIEDLAKDLKDVLRESPDWEQTADGKWKRKSQEPAPILGPCPRKCSECKDSDHHWIVECDESGEPIQICKHCSATRH